MVLRPATGITLPHFLPTPAPLRAIAMAVKKPIRDPRSSRPCESSAAIAVAPATVVADRIRSDAAGFPSARSPSGPHTIRSGSR